MHAYFNNHTDAVKRYLQRTGFAKADPKAALIDMDGTLYDSMPNHARAWSRLMAEEGIKASYDEFFLFEGRTGASTISILYQRQFGKQPSDEYKRELYQRKTVYFSELPRAEMMPGAAQLLNEFKARDIDRVLVTGSGQNSLISRIYTDYPGIFSPEKRITSADVERGKPDPEPYLKAMLIADVKPWQSIAVENAPLGVESAFRSQAFTIGVNTGPIDADYLVRAGADIVYESMQQCADDFPALCDALRNITLKL